ncbi:MAG: hypothetical protein F6J92_38490, partial [Symploca sp. SIO1A3]|nr:hypothetical protein [Symploca sp. SIO1A3]
MFTSKITLTGLTALTVAMLGTISSASAATFVADSVNEFSPVQGQNGWYYGYDNGNGFQRYLQQASLVPQPGGGNGNWRTPWGGFNATGGHFNGQTSPDWVIRRWKSDFNGTVNISANLPVTDDDAVGAGFKSKIMVNGKNLLSESSNSGNGSSNYQYNVDVEVGSVIDFAFAPNDDSWNSHFNFSAEITATSGLVFVESTNLPIDHVGLFFDDLVYESNKAYPAGDYWDLFSRDYSTIILDNGVNNKHSIGSFIHLSQSPNYSPVQNHNHVEIKEQYAEAMAAKIQTELNAGYLDNSTISTSVTPEMQK